MKSRDWFGSGNGIGAWMGKPMRGRLARKQCRQPVLELLEGRALLTQIVEYPTSAKTVVPTAITTGSDGNLWFIEQNGNAVVRLNPTTHAMTPFTHANG